MTAYSWTLGGEWNGLLIRGESGRELDIERGDLPVVSAAFIGVVAVLVVGQSFPPERYAGQSARSSGNEAPPRVLGPRWDKIAAAYETAGWARRRGQKCYSGVPLGAELAGVCSKENLRFHASVESVPNGV